MDIRETTLGKDIRQQPRHAPAGHNNKRRVRLPVVGRHGDAIDRVSVLFS
jgi:hypothetical protein